MRNSNRDQEAVMNEETKRQSQIEERSKGHNLVTSYHPALVAHHDSPRDEEIGAMNKNKELADQSDFTMEKCKPIRTCKLKLVIALRGQADPYRTGLGNALGQMERANSQLLTEWME
jgi:hypothetical protein